MDINQVILQRLNSNYRKTLLVDFVKDSFEIGNLAPDEREALSGQSITKISEYWAWFCNSEFVHVDSKRLCANFRLQPNSQLIYTRKIGNEWHKMLMEIIPLDVGEYGDKCLLSVRDIEQIYSKEYEAVVEKIGTIDSMTNLLNKFAFERDIARNSAAKIGVIYADLNGLKWTNDHLGHKAGDALIVKFAGLLAVNFGDYSCYHISGDEFVVCSYNKPQREFLSKAIAFHKSMWLALDYPIASIGYSIGEPGEIDPAISEAEKEMFDDKRIFYQKFPKFRRN